MHITNNIAGTVTKFAWRKGKVFLTLLGADAARPHSPVICQLGNLLGSTLSDVMLLPVFSSCLGKRISIWADTITIFPDEGTDTEALIDGISSVEITKKPKRVERG